MACGRPGGAVTSSALGNRPGGYALIAARPFNALNDAGWNYNLMPGYSIVTDGTAPFSPPHVGQAFYPAGYASGTAPIETWYDPSALDYTQMYVSFYVKLSQNWQPVTPSGINKIGFMWIHSNPVVYFQYAGASFPLAPQVNLQNSGQGARNLTQNVNTVSIASDGAWHHWEAQIIANTPGAANGSVTAWFDGVEIIHYTNVEYAGAGQPNTWQRISWQPTYGGVGNPVVSDMYMWMDEYDIWGAP